MRSIITACIILSSIMFSSTLQSYAQEWYLERLLEINTGIEVFDLNSITVDPMQFSNPQIQFSYDEFVKLDRILKDEFIKQYRSWEISYYLMSDIVHNYKNFVYYTNQTYYYLLQREQGYIGKQTDRAIKNGYSNMRVYYTRVKALVAKR